MYFNLNGRETVSAAIHFFAMKRRTNRFPDSENTAKIVLYLPFLGIFCMTIGKIGHETYNLRCDENISPPDFMRV